MTTVVKRWTDRNDHLKLSELPLHCELERVLYVRESTSKRAHVSLPFSCCPVPCPARSRRAAESLERLESCLAILQLHRRAGPEAQKKRRPRLPRACFSVLRFGRTHDHAMARLASAAQQVYELTRSAHCMPRKNVFVLEQYVYRLLSFHKKSFMSQAESQARACRNGYI
jgi:hypothetical protein